MKILLIHQYFLRQGEPGITRWNQFVKYWTERGHKITVIAAMRGHYMTGDKGREAYRGKFIVKEKIDKDVTVLRTYVSSGYNKNFARRLFAYFTFLLSSLFAVISVKKPDVVIATSPPLSVGITGYLASRLKKAPLVFEVRDLWPDFAVDAGIIKNKIFIKLSYWLEKFIYKKAILINVLTPAFKDILVNKKHVPSDKIVYVPNGVNFENLRPGPKNNWIRKKFNWNNKFIVLYVGAHGLANNLNLILDVAKLIKSSSSDAISKNIIFVFIGDGMEKPKLIQRAENERLDNIIFLNPVPREEIADYINASDVCVAILKKIYTTTYPNKVFDYMGCARPIILSISGAAKELVVDQAKAGVSVEPENPEEFEKAVLELYNDPNKREILGKNGYEYVKQNFSDKILAEKYEKILTKLTQFKML